MHNEYFKYLRKTLIFLKHCFLIVRKYLLFEKFLNSLFEEIPHRNPFLIARRSLLSLNKRWHYLKRLSFESLVNTYCIFLTSSLAGAESDLKGWLNSNQYHSSLRNFPLTWECCKSGTNLDIIDYCHAPSGNSSN